METHTSPGHTYTCINTSIISLCSHLPPVYRASLQDERGDANDGNKLCLVTNNTEKKKRANAGNTGGGKEGSAQIIIISPPSEATSGKATKDWVTLPRASSWTTNIRWLEEARTVRQKEMEKRKGVRENILQSRSHQIYVLISSGFYKNDRCLSISTPIICLSKAFNWCINKHADSMAIRLITSSLSTLKRHHRPHYAHGQKITN